MRDEDLAANIKHACFQTHLGGYSREMPKSVQGKLNSLRFEIVPETLAQRKKDGDAFLEKAEVLSLVEWKLKHGTYRPNLSKLVASNPDKQVRSTTHSAFEIYNEHPTDPAKALGTLTKLKGIGPATGSLLLACYDPDNIPFFSDEIYRYLHHEQAKSKGWDRKIGYTVKEYKSLFSKSTELRERLKEESGKPVRAVDVEKTAYSICKGALSDLALKREDQETDKALQPPSPKRRKKTPAKEPSHSPESLTR